MRQIGNLPDETQARLFSDHLVAKRIHNEVEKDDGAWAIWIKDEEQVADAKARLERFKSHPDAPEFRGADAEAAKVRATEAADTARYRKRLQSRSSVLPKFGGYGAGALTFALIIGCLIVAVYSRVGRDHELLRHFILADPRHAAAGFLPEVRAGEWWRLITPAFIHFGELHLIFNLMWLYQLGCMIEVRLGRRTLATLTVMTTVLPFLAQYIVSGPGYVGGMSGVIYGLLGFAWMRGKHDSASGVGVDHQTWVFMLAWLVLCFTGLMGNVANTAHLAGLIVGLFWGRASAWFAMR